MNHVSVSEALADLERVTEARGPGVVAFDGDGTLWTGDIADDVVHRLLRERLLRPECLSELLHLFPQSPNKEDPHALFEALVLADKGGTFDHRTTCEAVGSLLAGWGTDEFHAFCTETLKAADLPNRLIDETWTLRERAKSLGHTVVVVSASPLPVVRAACALVGEPDGALGVEVHERNHVYTASIARPIPYAEGKVAAVSRLAGAAPLIAAFGDNRFDLAMLEASELPFAIRPKKALIDAVASHDGTKIRLLK